MSDYERPENNFEKTSFSPEDKNQGGVAEEEMPKFESNESLKQVIDRSLNMSDITLKNSAGEGYLAKHGHEGALADSYNKSDGVILFKTNGIFYALPDTNENELNLKSFGFQQDSSIAVPHLNEDEVWAHSLKNSSYSKWKEMSQSK